MASWLWVIAFFASEEAVPFTAAGLEPHRGGLLPLEVGLDDEDL